MGDSSWQHLGFVYHWRPESKHVKNKSETLAWYSSTATHGWSGAPHLLTGDLPKDGQYHNLVTVYPDIVYVLNVVFSWFYRLWLPGLRWSQTSLTDSMAHQVWPGSAGHSVLHAEQWRCPPPHAGPAVPEAFPQYRCPPCGCNYHLNAIREEEKLSDTDTFINTGNAVLKVMAAQCLSTRLELRK